MMRVPGYTKLFTRYLYPLYNRWIGRDMFGFARERLITETMSSSEIKQLQFNKLKAVLINAEANVPFYRRRFREINFDPRVLSSFEEFAGLDFYVTKDDIRKSSKEFIADGTTERELHWHYTGGSTGEPLYFPTDTSTDAASAAAMIRALRWWDVEMGARHAILWGSPTYITRRMTDHVRKLGNSIRNILMNRLFISNYNLNEENIARYRKKLELFRPSYVRGMPSSLYVFARSILNDGKPLRNGAPKVIHSACEQLFDWQKPVIEEGFNARVANTYGLSEFGDIAFEAPCGGLHMMDEDVFVELRDFEAGEKEIVATQLNNMKSPLIRYRTADIAERITQCDCKLGLGILTGLKGRAHDFIIAPDGRFLHGQIFTHLIVYEAGVTNYQVRQETMQKLSITMVVTPDYSDESEVRLRTAINRYMASEINISFHYVDAIPLTRSGKHRWIISEVAGGLEY